MAQAVAMRREAIDAQAFGAFASGFCPGRRPPQALHAVRQGRLKHGMGSGIDGDISACVDHGPHDTLCMMLRQRIKDGRVLERSARWRKAGLLAGQALGVPDQGSPHGAVLSPLLATVSGPEVLATGWETVVHAHCRGKIVLDRSADDVVSGCEREEDARRRIEGCPKRCAQDGRESNPETTTVVRGGRPQRSAAERQAGTCRLLGFVHSWGTPWRGRDTIPRQTEGKRLRRRLGACGRWCRDHRHRALQAPYAFRGATRRGSDQDDGVWGHRPCLGLVYDAATRAWRYWLTRRGGRKRTWRAGGRRMAAYPRPRPQIGKGWVECRVGP